MHSKIRFLVLPIFLSVGFLFCDQFLKWQTLHSWNQTKLIFNNFGWYPFLNPGVAFGIPIPNFIVLSVTFPILIFILYTFISKIKQEKILVGGTFSKKNNYLIYSLVFIFTGALSNFIDRLRIKHTIDYLLVLTSVINLADLLIVIGFFIYFKFILKNKPSVS